MIRHYGDATSWDLHSHLARRDQNSEVRHSSLRPIGEARCERTLKTSIHRVVLSAFGRSRSTNQPVVDAIDVEPRKSTFHSGAFHLIERLGRNSHRCDTNPWAQSFEKRVVQLRLWADVGHFAFNVSFLRDLQVDDRQAGSLRNGCRGCHGFLLVFERLVVEATDRS